MKITDIPMPTLLAILRDTEALAGVDSIEAEIIRREIIRRDTQRRKAEEVATDEQ